MRREFAVLLLLSPAVGQTVWTVGGGGQFTEIQNAVSSPLVVPGDVILMLPSFTPSHEGFSLTKGVTVVGPETIRGVLGYRGAFTTRLDIPAGQTARLVDLAFEPGQQIYNLAGRVEVVGPGTVVFESCRIRGGHSTAGLAVTNGAHAILIGCDVSGGGGEAGVRIDRGHVAMQGSTISGGDSTCTGFGTSCSVPVGAGRGAAVQDGTLHAAECAFRGGTQTWSHIVAPTGVAAANSGLWLTDCTVDGGAHATAVASAVGGVGVSSSGQTARASRSTIRGGVGTTPGAATAGLVDVQALQLGVRVPNRLVRGQQYRLEYVTPNPFEPCLVLLGWAVAHDVLPLVAQPNWAFGSSSWVWLTGGVSDARGLWTLTATVPADPALEHREFWFHGFSGTTLPIEAAPPVGGTVR